MGLAVRILSEASWELRRVLAACQTQSRNCCGAPDCGLLDHVCASVSKRCPKKRIPALCECHSEGALCPRCRIVGSDSRPDHGPVREQAPYPNPDGPRTGGLAHWRLWPNGQVPERGRPRRLEVNSTAIKLLCCSLHAMRREKAHYVSRTANCRASGAGRGRGGADSGAQPAAYMAITRSSPPAEKPIASRFEGLGGLKTTAPARTSPSTRWERANISKRY